LQKPTQDCGTQERSVAIKSSASREIENGLDDEKGIENCAIGLKR
jgi:hypothetical protein